MIPQLNRQLYLEILLNHLSKFINREDICLKIANNTITINKKLLELNKYLLTKIKQIKQPTDEQNYLLLTLIKNFWLISHYETDCALVNINPERTYYYDKNKQEITAKFAQNEELKLSIK